MPIAIGDPSGQPFFSPRRKPRGCGLGRPHHSRAPSSRRSEQHARRCGAASAAAGRRRVSCYFSNYPRIVRSNHNLFNGGENSRFQPHGQGYVRQGPQSQDRDVPRRLHHPPRQLHRSVPSCRLPPRRGQLHVAEAVVAVNGSGEVQVPFDQRFGGSPVDRYIRSADQLHQPQRVLRTRFHLHIAEDRRQSIDLELPA